MEAIQRQELGESRAAIIVWGILTIAVGYFLLVHPQVTAIIWVEIMAFSWLIGGVFDAVNSLTQRGDYWGWRLTGAVIGIIAGLYIIGNPILGTLFTVQIAFIFLAISALVGGAVNFMAGFRMQGSERWLAIILGVLQAIIGMWLILHPIAGMLTLVPVLGIILIIGGIIIVIASFRLT